MVDRQHPALELLDRVIDRDRAALAGRAVRRCSLFRQAVFPLQGVTFANDCNRLRCNRLRS